MSSQNALSEIWRNSSYLFIIDARWMAVKLTYFRERGTTDGPVVPFLCDWCSAKKGFQPFLSQFLHSDSLGVHSNRRRQNLPKIIPILPHPIIWFLKIVSPPESIWHWQHKNRIVGKCQDLLYHWSFWLITWLINWHTDRNRLIAWLVTVCTVVVDWLLDWSFFIIPLSIDCLIDPRVLYCCSLIADWMSCMQTGTDWLLDLSPCVLESSIDRLIDRSLVFRCWLIAWLIPMYYTVVHWLLDWSSNSSFTTMQVVSWFIDHRIWN